MPRPGANAAVSVERFFEFSMLGLVTSGFLAVAGSGYLDPVTTVLTAGGLAARALLIAGILRFAIPGRLATLATLAYLAFIPLDYYLVARDFMGVTVRLVFFLTVAKTLTARTGRDYAYLAVLAFLQLLAAAVLSGNLNFFLFLALYLLFAMAAFTSSEIRRSVEQPQRVARAGLRRFHWRLAALSCLITAGILALTGGLFFMLPRTAGAAFNRAAARRAFLPGLSSQVSLGEIGELKNSSQPVMRVRVFADPAIAAHAKWRGAALAEFDGRRWSSPLQPERVVQLERGRTVLANEYERPGRHFAYAIDLDPLNTDTLFFAGLPEVLEMAPASVIRTADDGFRLGQPPRRIFRYRAYAFLEDAAVPPRPGLEITPAEIRRRYLQLPSLDPRVRTLARRMAVEETTDMGRARVIEHRLRTEYRYTLELPREKPADPLADFLFVRREGHCEYFASAMTVMLRTMGIPARLVNGFQSGVWNPFTERYVIRASDAHSWVEAWISGYGWTTFDPTPPDPAQRAFPLAAKFALYLDTAETFWREWVLGYDLGRQAFLADGVFQSGQNLRVRWVDRALGVASEWKAAAFEAARRHGRLLLVAALCFWLVRRLGPRLHARLRVRRRVRRVRLGEATTADATLLYGRMLDLLRKRGYHKPSWFTPAEFAHTLPPQWRAPVAQFTAAYNAVRFGADLEAAPRLSALLDQIEGVHT